MAGVRVVEVSGDSSVSSWSGATVAEAAARLAAAPRAHPALSPTAESLLASLGGGSDEPLASGDVFRRPGPAPRLTTWSTASLGGAGGPRGSSGRGEVQDAPPGHLATLPPVRRPEQGQVARRERGGQEARVLHMLEARRQQVQQEQQEHRGEVSRVEERVGEDITYEQFTEQKEEVKDEVAEVVAAAPVLHQSLSRKLRQLLAARRQEAAPRQAREQEAEAAPIFHASSEGRREGRAGRPAPGPGSGAPKMAPTFHPLVLGRAPTPALTSSPIPTTAAEPPPAPSEGTPDPSPITPGSPGAPLRFSPIPLTQSQTQQQQQAEEDDLDRFIESRMEEEVGETRMEEEVGKSRTEEVGETVEKLPDLPLPKRKTVFNAPYVKNKQCRLTEYFPPTTIEAARVAKGRPKEGDQVFLTEEALPQVMLAALLYSVVQVMEVVEGAAELAMTIVLLGGATQLAAAGLGVEAAQAVLVRAVGKEGEPTVLRVALWSRATSPSVRQFFWQHVMLHPKARKFVYDSKAFLSCVASAYKGEVQVAEVELVDPLVGCWLLQPDTPPNTFRGCQQALGGGQGGGGGGGVAAQLGELAAICRTMVARLEGLGLGPVFQRLEMRLVPHLVAMERRGVGVDEARLEVLGTNLDQQLAALEQEAHRAAGREFNLCSPAQVRTVIFDDLKLDKKGKILVGKTTGGVKSTCESVLQAMVPLHPLPGLVLRHRQLAKLRSTYVEGLQHHCQAGRVFTSWDQLAAATGRLTSVTPNLQGVPKGDIEAGGRTVRLRSSIVPSGGFVFLCADFEQIELRIYAALSGDEGLLAATREGGDIFCRLAATWLGKELAAVTESDRERTKHLVYALMYGAGKARLADILTVTVEQAGAIMAGFYTKFATLRAFNQRVLEAAARDGFLTTLLHRRRYFPGIRAINKGQRAQAQRSAFNFLLQGSAADLAKLALLAAQAALREAGLDTALVLMIHDELVWEVAQGQVGEAAAVVEAALRGVGEAPLLGRRMTVDLPVKVTWGTDLGTLQALAQGRRP